MRMFATGLALLVALASPDFAFAKAKKTPEHPTIIHAPVRAPGPYPSLIRRPHSPNPRWDVYRVNGRYVGTDPDPNVRLMLRKDNWSQYD
jgi:hypothetical protein